MNPLQELEKLAARQHKETEQSFLKEWKPFDVLHRKAKQAIYNYFAKGKNIWQPTHDASSKSPFEPVTFSQIENTLGLPYTSSSDYAGLWVTNGGYLWADETHYFVGFAITDKGRVVGIAHDYEENEIFKFLM